MADHHLSEEQARRLWERAAQLQEDARRRADEAERALPVKAEPEGGFALEHVRQAAVEAGIDAAFVDEAWTDQQVGVDPPSPKLDRQITRFLGGDVRALEARRVIDAPADRTLEAIRDVFTSESCKLRLSDQIGGHPLEGGALVFDASYDYTTGIGKAVMWSDMKHFIVRLRPIDAQRTEVHIRSPLDHSRKLNFSVGSIFNAVVSVGGAAGAAALAGVAGAALPVVIPAGIVGFTGVWWGGTRAYQALFRKAMRVGQEGLDGLLRQLAVHVGVGADVRPRLSP